MKIISTLVLCAAFGCSAVAQTTITNGGFENWGNASPGISGPVGEPTSWYSNKSGGGLADLGPQTCFKDSIDQHSGLYCVKLITESGIAVVNGVVTTGVVDAPSATITTKDSGYVGTVKYVSSGTSTDDRRMAFTGRPDSLVGWYKYTPGGSGEMGKIRCILHTGDYFDPETPTNSYHPITFANRIADDTFFTPSATVSTWTRFSVPFTYYSTSSPTYIMINATSSANQATTISGSTLWLDDLEVVYAPAITCNTVTSLAASAITATSATISWTAVSGSLGYVYAVDMSATPPASGTFTTSTSVSVTGLTAGTAYYAHVYDSCAVGSASGWVTVPFATTSASGCNAVTSLAASTITSNSATITWGAPSGSVGAEYEINTTSSDPTDNGTATTASTYNATGLTSATNYYAHVRDSCGATSLSAWVTTPFTTLSTAGFNNSVALGFGVTAYPNPVKDELTINITGVENISGRIELMDLSGRIIKAVAVNTDVANMSMSGLPAGVYVIRYTDSKHTQTIKVSKQ